MSTLNSVNENRVYIVYINALLDENKNEGMSLVDCSTVDIKLGLLLIAATSDKILKYLVGKCMV